MDMRYLGLALVLLALWPATAAAFRTWKHGGNRSGALGVAGYALVALALAVYQFFLRW